MLRNRKATFYYDNINVDFFFYVGSQFIPNEKRVDLQRWG